MLKHAEMRGRPDLTLQVTVVQIASNGIVSRIATCLAGPPARNKFAPSLEACPGVLTGRII